MFTVVQHHHRRPVPQEADQAVNHPARRPLGADGLGNNLGNGRGTAHTGQPDQPHPIRIPLGDRGAGCLKRQTGLAGAAGTGQGDQPVCTQQLA